MTKAFELYKGLNCTKVSETKKVQPSDRDILYCLFLPMCKACHDLLIICQKVSREISLYWLSDISTSQHVMLKWTYMQGDH